MHGDPLQLIPDEHRAEFCGMINEGQRRGMTRLDFHVEITGEICPLEPVHVPGTPRKSRRRLDESHERHRRQKRFFFSEQDRVGIGTFQPKDEKNQDSTELTGDINYRKIAEYGSESDPRAFNFDGEFNVANRGMIEFIEVLEARCGFPLRPSWGPRKSIKSNPRSSRKRISIR